MSRDNHLPSRREIIARLYQALESVVDRTLAGEVCFGRPLRLGGDPYLSGKFALALALLAERTPGRLVERAAEPR